ncbi:hypothetical protein BDF14DRAFT_1733618 [Spinellus fusiger]|nr:hypothetical protein BDF14DRAFT_1733618 [Spinellus fusiger]
MGLIGKVFHKLELHKIDQYTKRRLSQSHFKSHDKNYYKTAYQDGVYIEVSNISNAHSIHPRSFLSYKASDWSLADLLRKK